MDVFKAKNYVSYIEHCLTRGNRRIPRGELSRLASSLNCHPTFIRQVLSGKANFSNEQSLLFCRYQNLNEEQTEYFIDLVNRDRAGTIELKVFYENRLTRTKSYQTDVSKRLKSSFLNDQKSKERYFGSWLIQIVHCLSHIAKYRNQIPALLQNFGVQENDIRSAMNTLVELGLATKKNNSLWSTENYIHLAKGDIYETHFHTTWRNYSINKLLTSPGLRSESLHFSSLLTLSSSTSKNITSRLLNLLEEAKAEVSQSPSEEVHVLGIDFFSVIK